MRCTVPPAAPDVVHVAGAIANVDDQIRWTRIRRPALELKPPCCDCGSPNVQLTTSMVVSVTASQGAAVPILAMPEAKDPRTLRHCPFVKQRYHTCKPFVRSLFADVGRSLVLPWTEAAISILIPQTVSSDGGVAVNVDAGWLIDPPAGATITNPLGGAFLAWDAWIWAATRCTECCEPSDAILTDSAILSAGAQAAVLFVVPPGADELEVVAGEAAATVNVSWVNGDGTIANSRFIGQSAFGNAAFGNQEPRCICVPPRSTHVMVVTSPNDIPIALAWRIKP